MKTTDSQNLPYPEINDYGNGALQLQVLAEAADAKLVQANTDYDVVLEPAVSYVLATLNTSPLAALFTYDLAGLISGYSYYSEGSFNGMFGDGPGIYLVGYSVRMAEAGATTADALRQLTLYIYDHRAEGASGNAIQATQRIEFWGNNVNEINSGAIVDRFTFAIPVAIYKPATASIRLEFTHYNTASSVIVQAGSYIWATRTGDLGV